MPRLARIWNQQKNLTFILSLNKHTRIYLHILIRFRDYRVEKAFTKRCIYFKSYKYSRSNILTINYVLHPRKNFVDFGGTVRLSTVAKMRLRRCDRHR